MKGPSWDEIDRFIDEKMRRDYGRLVDRHFRGIIVSVSGDGPFTCTVARNGETEADGNSYTCANFIPRVADEVECMWRDQSTGYVLWPLNRAPSGGLPPPGLVGQVLALNANLDPVWATLTNPPVFGSYAAEVLADSPTNWWRTNDTTGTTAVDRMGLLNATYGGNFTLASATGPLPHDVQQVASYLYDPGTGAGNFTAHQLNSNFGNNHSLEMWWKRDGGTSIPSVYDGWANAAATGDRWMALRYASGGAPDLHLYANNIDQGAFGDSLAWNNIIWTYDNSNIRVYLNKNLVATQSVTAGGIRANATYIQVGNATTDSNLVTHAPDIITYNSTLSAARVAAHYDAR